MIKAGLNDNGKQSGFSMVELLIAMAVFVLTIVAATTIFVPLLTQFKQQSKAAETQIESVVGLEILRRDIAQAGFGVPWNIPAAVSYNESTGVAAAYNDCSGSTSCNPPRAILSGNGVSFANIVNGSDYLVIKATTVAMNNAAAKWTDISALAGGAFKIRTWGSSVEDLCPNASCSTPDNVIVIIPSRGGSNQRILVNNGAGFTAQFDSSAFPPAYAPATPGDVYLIYGVNASTSGPLRMPFNRADYYVSTSPPTGVPARCAPNTGVLVKSVLNNDAAGTYSTTPLLDCVADMQVVYGLDNDSDGFFVPGTGGDGYQDDITALSAQQIRNQVKEVRVYILAHEGQKDATYTYPNNSVIVGEDLGLGRTFNLQSAIGTGWQNYRWKVYELIVKTRNLG
jgi:prepilin-type N-terminal cleavage/methylation domain-containing protein